MNQRYITCKRVRYTCYNDEDVFFEWIKSMPCIQKFDGAHDELYLDLIDEELSYDDIQDLAALLYRYKIDMKQLQPLITENNKDAIKPWKKQIYKP